MNEELDQLLRNLKLHRMQAVFDEQLRAAGLSRAKLAAGRDLACHRALGRQCELR